MAYRNGTYVAFHANGTNYPLHSDIRYYNMIKAWSEKSDDEFTIVNSHDKTSAVRDSSSKETLRTRLLERLRNSKNMVLIIGETTKLDDDWVPFEIEYAVDVYKIPLIVTYIGIDYGIQRAINLSSKWPAALKARIENETAHAIHIPFKKAPIYAAVRQFDHNNFPNGKGFGVYNQEAYSSWDIPL